MIEPILSAHVDQIASLLGVPPGDTYTRDNIRDFIYCNGYLGLREAAAETVSTIARGRTVQHPWKHTVGVYNGMIGRAGLLYHLLHLIEQSLRSWLSIHMDAVHGEAWHLELPRLLDASTMPLVQRDLDRARIVDRITSRERSPDLPDFSSGAEFIQYLDLHTLIRLIGFAYGPPRRRPYGMLWRDPNPATEVMEDVPWTKLAKHLYTARRLRNDVMHHRGVTRNQFQAVEPELQWLLLKLGHNIDRVVFRTELARFQASADMRILRAPIAAAVETAARVLAEQRGRRERPGADRPTGPRP